MYQETAVCDSGHVKTAAALLTLNPAQELTRHAANLGMLAAATVNPDQRNHFYLGFQAEHKLAYSGARRRLPCVLCVCRSPALRWGRWLPCSLRGC